MTAVRVDPAGYGRLTRAYDRLRGTQTGLVALALAVGAGQEPARSSSAI